VSTLKLRGSWGTAGGNDLNYTDTYGNYTSAVYDQLSGIQRPTYQTQPKMGNHTNEDIAVDAGFLKDRISLTIDVYNKLTLDRLDSKPLPAEAPFSSIKFNNGTSRIRVSRSNLAPPLYVPEILIGIPIYRLPTMGKK